MFKKVCDCGEEFYGTGPAARYCKSCKQIAIERTRQRNRERNERARRARGCKVGRGAERAEKHPNYKHGYWVAQTQSREYREKVQFCERCGVDTHRLGRWHWVMHHKDHNHANHSEDNLELLCKRCHAREHLVQHNCEKV